MSGLLNRRRVLRATALVAVVAATVAVLRLVGGGTGYTVLLPDAAGIRAGDDVRVAGIPVGSVTSVAAKGAQVVVEIEVDEPVRVTDATRSEVKLSSLLGQRYLELEPGRGRPLESGATLPLANANGSYTIERFWIDSAPTLTELDLATLSRAVDVLSTDLAVSPESTQDALAGMTAVAGMINAREAQVGRLLSTTREVTDEVVAQRKQITGLMTSADQVMAMVAQRKQAIDALLRSADLLARDLSAMARTNAKPMTAALAKLEVILRTLRAHRDDLADTLELAAPAMRMYVNSAGDGPWLGVNAPYFIMPDSFWCISRKDIGCK